MATIHQRHFLQDRYVVYNWSAGTLQYGYVDPLSASPNEELRWPHISKDGIRFPLCVVFTADHDLGVGLNYIHGFVLATSWMKHLNYHHLQDQARPNLSSLRCLSSQKARFIRFRSSPSWGFLKSRLGVVCATVGQCLVEMSAAFTSSHGNQAQ